MFTCFFLPFLKHIVSAMIGGGIIWFFRQDEIDLLFKNNSRLTREHRELKSNHTRLKNEHKAFKIRSQSELGEWKIKNQQMNAQLQNLNAKPSSALKSEPETASEESATIEKEIIKKVEKIVEVPVEVIKEVEKRVEVQVGVIKEIEVIAVQKVPTEIFKEVSVPKEIVTEVEKIVNVPLPLIKEIEAIEQRQVPVELIREIEVTREVPVEKIIEKPISIIKEIEATCIQKVPVEIVREVPVEKIVEVEKEVEVIREVPVEVIIEKIVEVPVEIIREVMREVPSAPVNPPLVDPDESLKSATDLESSSATENADTEDLEYLNKLNLGDGPNDEEESYILTNEFAEEMVNEKDKANSDITINKTVESEEVLSGIVEKDFENRDNLIVIEGIGPKIERLLFKNGIYTFRQLARMSVSDLKDLLSDEGPRYQVNDPTTWPLQAELAAEGNWDELREWQEKLDSGRI